MNPREISSVENLETDIVILGAGGGGLAAAVAAAEEGARVIVLEKRGSAGGNSAMAVGLFACESPVQKRQRIDAGKDQCFKIAMNYSHWRINPRIVRAFIDKSGDTIRWLEDRGLKIEKVFPGYPNQAPLVWHVPEKWGIGLVKVLLKHCADRGVAVLCQTAAKKILTDKSGKAAGVLAVNTKENKEYKITAKSVIVATGGYGGNKEMLRKYYAGYNEEMLCRGVPNTGDGIMMAMEAGAATEGLGILQLGAPHFRGFYNLWSVALNPEAVWVNKNGERFIDESVGLLYFESVGALLRQPGQTSYSLFDDRIRRVILEEGLTTWATLTFGTEKLPMAMLDKQIKLSLEKGIVRVADSWEEIARWAGVPPKALKATIDGYNACCDVGHDGVFAKERKYLAGLRTPPYYALECHVAFLGTIGGIKINERMEVLNRQDSVIPGLYAVGIDAGGWEGENYCGVLSGSTFGFAVNSGRIAGEIAAGYVARK